MHVTPLEPFLNDGKLLKQINHTLMSLIPKVDNPATTTQL